MPEGTEENHNNYQSGVGVTVEGTYWMNILCKLHDHVSSEIKYKDQIDWKRKEKKKKL